MTVQLDLEAINTDQPLYQRLYLQLRDAIVSGSLAAYTQLPSTRALAQQLNVSRNTVVTAYEQLMVEGYVRTGGLSGTFVASLRPDQTRKRPTPKRRAPVRVADAARATLALADDGSVGGASVPFRMGLPALDAFPLKLWRRLLSRRVRALRTDAFFGQSAAGYLPLRRAIAEHVTILRQIRCDPAQVLIVSGTQGGLELVGRALVNPGDPVWVEDPGYPSARLALAAAGARLVPVPLDADGLDVAAGERRAPDARLAYVTPSHQYALGIMMSQPRRLTLLDWAMRSNAYVFEDDYDSEFQFKGKPLPALAGLDHEGRVIYCGTFSKTMFPALRLGYLIAPPDLVDALTRMHTAMLGHLPVLEQMALADFLADGHYARHLRRMRGLYGERRDALRRPLEGSALQLQPAFTGMHAVALPTHALDIAELARRARASGLIVRAASEFALAPLTTDGLLLGYAACTPTAIARGVATLLRLI